MNILRIYFDKTLSNRVKQQNATAEGFVQLPKFASFIRRITNGEYQKRIIINLKAIFKERDKHVTQTPGVVFAFE